MSQVFKTVFLSHFLNQMHAGHRLVRTWFLEIDSVRDVCMRVCVCLSPRLLITSGMI